MKPSEKSISSMGIAAIGTRIFLCAINLPDGIGKILDDSRRWQRLIIVLMGLPKEFAFLLRQLTPCGEKTQRNCKWLK